MRKLTKFLLSVSSGLAILFFAVGYYFIFVYTPAQTEDYIAPEEKMDNKPIQIGTKKEVVNERKIFGYSNDGRAI